ncbi:hypothetical protein DICPUDRAFT_57477 [Dictyostelium purpureum]|uniref:Major facilitator superfamily (MFS) profile domain-containing protein n=1 Tax=Dictyostelium purpureum TaxID=5786 RepID=F0ZW65_DICPU|nr:uncharacterized protein DICPUDRAFT_57477 [Dictyostelium purpureum]EGC31816.1 hypothetical protein DICPUDRAFT_57477 [Dictyostelium purpureum]|eukprot:XP_003291650.1 hypothetical protein DICPUDRAFT_57477 [Dictyostelium purpureum]
MGEDKYDKLNENESINDVKIQDYQDNKNDHQGDIYKTDSTGGLIKFMFWLFAICFSLAGVQFVYSIQFALGTPLFINKFKLTPSTTSIIQSTAGPISGFLVQPIIGVYSDTCKSKFGRRKPFIVFGSIFCIAGLILIAFSPLIGQALGDKESSELTSDHKIGLIIAIAGFWIMNLSVNVMQGPTRSLVSDLCPMDKQHLGNSMAVNVMGFASIIANIIGSFFASNENSYRDLFIIGAGFVACSVIPTIFVAKEKQLDSSVQSPKSPIDVFKKIGFAFRTIPKELAIISLVFFISWFGYSPFMVNNTTYFQKNVFPENANKGLEFGFYAQAALSAVSFLFSFFLSGLINLVGEKLVYSVSQAIAGACLILFLVFDHASPGLAIALTALVGINFCTFNAVPFAMMVKVIPSKDIGLYMGVLNSSAVVSQTISILTSGRVLAAKNQDTAWAMAYGGLFTILGVFLAWILPKSKGPELIIDENNNSDNNDNNKQSNETTPLLNN